MTKNYFTLPYTDSHYLGETLNFKFNSFPSFIQNLEKRKNNKIAFSRFTKSNSEKESGFNSHDSLDEAIDILKIAKNPSKETQKLIFNESRNNNKLVITDEPIDVLSIPEFLSGSPYYWAGWKKNKKVRKQIIKNIFLSVGVRAGVGSDNLSKYLDDVCNHIFTNYMFEKIIITNISSISESNSEWFQMYIDISYKDAIMMFRTSYTDFFRRVLFYFKEQSSSLPGGYGVSLLRTDVTPEKFLDLKNRNSIFFDFVTFKKDKTP